MNSNILLKKRTFFGTAIPLPIMIFFFAVVFSFFLMPSGHAAADCGVNTFSTHDYAGAVVESVWKYTDGTYGGTSDNTTVSVKTVGTATPGGNVIHLASDHTGTINRQYSETFNQYDSGCGDGHNVVLGYNDTHSTNETSDYSGSGQGHTTNGTVWALDCDISVHASYYEQFDFTGVGTPSGIPAGRTGTWNTVRSDKTGSGGAANGQTLPVKLVFTLDPVKNKPPLGSFKITVDNANCKTYYSELSGYDQEVPIGNFKYRVLHDNASGSGTTTTISGYTYLGANKSGVANFTAYRTHQLQIYDPDDSTWYTVDTQYVGYVKTGCTTGIQSTSECLSTYIRDVGTNAYTQFQYDAASGNYLWSNAKSRTHLFENGSPAASGGFTGDFVGDSSPLGIQHTWIHAPTGRTISKLIIYQEYRHHKDRYLISEAYTDPPTTNKDGSVSPGAYHPAVYGYNDYDQWDEVYRTDRTFNCFTATCTVTDVYGDGPNRVVTSGGTMHVTVNLTNVSPPNDPYPGLDMPDPYYINGYRLGVTGTGGDHNLDSGLANGDTGTMSFDVGADGGGTHYQSISFTPNYNGGFSLGDACGTSVNIYEPFTVDQVRGNASLAPDEEDPTSFSYGTYLCANASVSFNIPTSSSAYAIPNGGGQVALNSNSGGTYHGCGTIWSGTSATLTTRNAGDNYCSHIEVGYTSGYVGANGPGDLVGQDGPTNATACRNIHDEPYVHALASDIFAGGGYGAGCTTSAGGINTYLTTTGGKPRGSGGQIGALAIGPINGFSSANLRDTPPLASVGLTFRNDQSVASGIPSPALGGSLGGSHCVPNFFADAPIATPDNSSAINLNSGSSITKYYEPSGGTLTIDGGSIGNGANVSVYVKGNVVIKNNITYASTDWGTIENIPSVRIVAYGGNIYLHPSVSQLDGLYVTQPNSSASGGTIYTCSDGTNQYANAGIYQACRKQLVVNGAFVSQKAYLNRAFSSRRYSASGEKLGTGSKDCGQSGTGRSDCASEIFNFTPEIFLGKPSIAPSSGPTTGKYDYITSLAPVL